MPKIVHNGPRNLIEHPVTLTVGQTSGRIPISIPFAATYMGIINNTAATISVGIGEPGTAPPEAIPVNQGVYISFPIQETQKLTLFWTSLAAMSAGNNQVVVIFSNEEFGLSGGVMSTGGVSSNVQITNPSIPVTFAGNQNVNVVAAPPSSGSDGVANRVLHTDASGNLYVQFPSAQQVTFPSAQPVSLSNVSTLTAGSVNDALALGTLLQAMSVLVAYDGTNYGRLRMDTNKNLKVSVADDVGSQSMTASPKTAQTTISTTATRLNVSGTTDLTNRKTLIVRNLSKTDPIYIGDNTVTTTTGYPIQPGEVWSVDQNPDFTSSVYAISAVASVAVAVMEVQ